MPYLLSEQSAEWLRAQRSRAGDLRSRPRRTRTPDGSAAPAWPQWRPSIVPGDGEDARPRLEIGPGWVWMFDAEVAEGEDGSPRIAATASRHHFDATDLGEAAEPGAAVWRYVDGDESGNVVFVPDGETPPDGAHDVVLATLSVPDSGAPSAHPVHVDTIFFTRPTEEPEEPGGGDGRDAGENDPGCGNPMNRPPSDRNPLDEPGGGGGGDNSSDKDDENPLDHEGDGGFTPKCAD